MLRFFFTGSLVFVLFALGSPSKQSINLRFRLLFGGLRKVGSDDCGVHSPLMPGTKVSSCSTAERKISDYMIICCEVSRANNRFANESIGKKFYSMSSDFFIRPILCVFFKGRKFAKLHKNTNFSLFLKFSKITIYF